MSDQNRRGFWLRHLHRWHWISSGLCLIGMLLFAATGITLNHAGDIAATPVVTSRQAMLPPPALRLLQDAVPQDSRKPLPDAVRAAAGQALGIAIPPSDADWSDELIYLDLPRPGGEATLSIDRATGDISYERTDRGWVSYFNDLHKGRNAGPAWGWFIDIFAGACLVFTITGLVLLQLHAGNRPATWPIVGFGLLVPLLLALLFIHR
ncbi:PepSY-associated TM helix domain-containing protein [Sphingomonas oleivorans]|nr:PepSY-associated TM helix domain-containing protein [Sphingomonas oleivorans]